MVDRVGLEEYKETSDRVTRGPSMAGQTCERHGPFHLHECVARVHVPPGRVQMRTQVHTTLERPALQQPALGLLSSDTVLLLMLPPGRSQDTTVLQRKVLHQLWLSARHPLTLRPVPGPTGPWAAHTAQPPP